MKVFGILFIAATMMLTSFSAPAFAEDVDMAKISCKDFLADQQNMPMMVMWIDGYMSGKSDNTAISEEWIAKLGTHLGEFCAKNSGKTIMDAIEAMPE